MKMEVLQERGGGEDHVLYLFMNKETGKKGGLVGNKRRGNGSSLAS